MNFLKAVSVGAKTVNGPRVCKCSATTPDRSMRSARMVYPRYFSCSGMSCKGLGGKVGTCLAQLVLGKDDEPEEVGTW